MKEKTKIKSFKGLLVVEMPEDRETTMDEIINLLKDGKFIIEMERDFFTILVKVCK